MRLRTVEEREHRDLLFEANYPIEVRVRRSLRALTAVRRNLLIFVVGSSPFSSLLFAFSKESCSKMKKEELQLQWP
jgi:hypothetical protein